MTIELFSFRDLFILHDVLRVEQFLIVVFFVTLLHLTVLVSKKI